MDHFAEHAATLNARTSELMQNQSISNVHAATETGVITAIMDRSESMGVPMISVVQLQMLRT
jgi:hypothetical protein